MGKKYTYLYLSRILVVYVINIRAGKWISGLDKYCAYSCETQNIMSNSYGKHLWIVMESFIYY